MMKVSKHILISCFVILCTSVFSVFAQVDPVVSVENFYKFQRARTGALSTHEVNLLKAWLSADLIALLKKEIRREDEYVRKNPNDKPYFGDGLPFSPLEECVVNQKIFYNRIEVSKQLLEVNKAAVEVRFYIAKECEDQTETKLIDTYRIELKKGKTRWLISDWIYSDGKRLSEVLRREKYN